MVEPQAHSGEPTVTSEVANSYRIAVEERPSNREYLPDFLHQHEGDAAVLVSAALGIGVDVSWDHLGSICSLRPGKLDCWWKTEGPVAV